MTQVICIACPKGCRLQVDEELRVTGQGCPRGEKYARDEVRNPMRVLTSTVRVQGGIHRRCPVKTDGAIPKGRMREAVKALEQVTLRAPVEEGQVVVVDVCKTGVNVVTTRDMPGEPDPSP